MKPHGQKKKAVSESASGGRLLRFHSHHLQFDSKHAGLVDTQVKHAKGQQT